MSASVDWPARFTEEPRQGWRELAPSHIDASWRPLAQSWRAGGAEPGFESGWARVSWDERCLFYDMIFVGGNASNRARALNERTWEMGDVCEIFLQVSGRPRYIELHVTPENRRLQLQWPPGGCARMRRGAARLEDFTIGREDWVQTATRVATSYWVVRAIVPVRAFDPGGKFLTPASSLDTAVCRYDCSTRASAVLSSTAPFQACDFHRRHEWQRLVLATTRLD